MPDFIKNFLQGSSQVFLVIPGRSDYSLHRRSSYKVAQERLRSDFSAVAKETRTIIQNKRKNLETFSDVLAVAKETRTIIQNKRKNLEIFSDVLAVAKETRTIIQNKRKNLETLSDVLAVAKETRTTIQNKRKGCAHGQKQKNCFTAEKYSRRK